MAARIRKRLLQEERTEISPRLKCKGRTRPYRRDFSGEPKPYDELEDFVGSKDKPVIEGEVFKIESIPIKNGKSSDYNTHCFARPGPSR